MAKIYSLGMDGLNGSGKGTQIELFSKYLDSISEPHLIARGDGVRFGNGIKIYDSPSKWWSENIDWLLDKTDNPQDKLNLQYQRLSREAEALRRKLERDFNGGVILFDRSFPSRVLTMRQYNPGISIEDSLQSRNPRNGICVKPIIPDLTVVLDVPQEILLDRLPRENTLGNIARRRILLSNYGFYAKLVEELKPRTDVLILDGTQTKEDINEQIVEAYSNARK